MANLTLLYGSANADKTTRLLEVCRQRLCRGQGDTFVYLVPSIRRAQYLQRILLDQTDTNLLIAPYILGLEPFLKRLYRVCPEPATILPEGAAPILVEDILHQHAEQLTYFRQTSDQLSYAGLAGTLAELFNQFKAAAITPQALSRLRPQITGLAGIKGEEITTLYSAYQQRLGEQLTDQQGMLQAILNHLTPERFQQIFRTVDLFIVDGFDLFTPLLSQVLQRLFEIVPQPVLILDFDPSRPRLFGYLQRTFDAFAQLAGHTERVDRPPTTDPLQSLGGALFASQAEAQPIDSGGRIRIHHAQDRLAEVEWIARDIKRRCLENPTKLSRFCVTFRDMRRYAPLIQEIFPRFGLPYNLSFGYLLAQAPIVVAIQSLLNCVLEGYARRALVRLLNLPYVRFQFDHRGQKRVLSGELFDTWARRLRSPANRQNWLRLLDQRIQQIQTRIINLEQDLFDTAEMDDPEAEKAALAEDLAQLRQLRSGMDALLKTLAELQKSAPLATWRQRLLAVISRLQIPQRLVQTDPETVSPPVLEREVRAYTRFLECLDELTFLAPFLKQTAFSLSEFTELLRTLVNEKTYVVHSQPGQGVQVLGLLEIRGIGFEHLYLGGLVEGQLPRIPRTPLFLDDADRAALGLPTRADALPEDRFLFYQAVVNPCHTLTLLCPASDGTDPLVSSSFLEEIQRLIHRPTPTDDARSGYFWMPALQRWAGRVLAGPRSNREVPLASQTLRGLAAHPRWQATAAALLRGLALADRRAQPQLSSHEGLLDDPQAIAEIRHRFNPGYPFSITQLETYARCPFLFFSQRLLGLQPLEEPEEDLSALARGDLIHRILFRFYNERRQDGDILPVTPENLDLARQQIHRIAVEEFDRLGFRDLFWEQERFRLLTYDPETGREGLLMRFLSHEAGSNDRANPAFIEFSFGGYRGMGAHDPHSQTRPYRLGHGETTVHISGKIDRIDTDAAGHFLVYDYKTGSQLPGLEDIQEGLSLQLPVYLLAAENALQSVFEAPFQGIGGAYYQLRDAQSFGKRNYYADKSYHKVVFQSQARGVMEPVAFQALLQQTTQRILDYARGIRTGRFHVTCHATSRVCSFCDLKRICRVDQERMRTLMQEGVVPP